MAMEHSIDEMMEEARQYFHERAQAARSNDARALNEHLRELAEVVQENTRMIETLHRDLEKVHHVLGVR
jgi:hypothetical protein